MNYRHYVPLALMQAFAIALRSEHPTRTSVLELERLTSLPFKGFSNADILKVQKVRDRVWASVGEQWGDKEILAGLPAMIEGLFFAFEDVFDGTDKNIRRWMNSISMKLECGYHKNSYETIEMFRKTMNKIVYDMEKCYGSFNDE